MANGSFGTLAPVYGYEQGLDASGIALLFAIAAILGAVAQIPFGRLSDRIDRRIVLIGLSGLASVVGLLTVLINPEAGWMMYVLFALYGFAANPDLCGGGGPMPTTSPRMAISPRSPGACC